MSEPREECYKCLNSSNCILIADYGSLYCVTNRKFNKTADEMFEKLRYKKTKNNKKWIKYKSTKDYAEIWFDITDRGVSATNDDSEGIFISMQELAAINAKCRELGWTSDKEATKVRQIERSEDSK